VSHQADRCHHPPANPPDQKGVAEDPDSRLVPNIRMSKRMRPFVNRMRLRLKDLDLTDPDAAARLDQAQEDMWSILKRMKTSRTVDPSATLTCYSVTLGRHRTHSPRTTARSDHRC
jgi:hypothetical protein